MSKYKVGVLGLHMGNAWARAVHANSKTELCIVYDPHFGDESKIDCDFYRQNAKVADTENELYDASLDIIIVASPDHFHAEQSVRALRSGSHVICEKPLAPTLADCKEIIAAVEGTKRFFMTGQVGRYAPGFILAKKLIDDGRIGEIGFIESEYAHDYTHAPGVDNWRKDPKIAREGIIGGGCHAMDLVRWMAGNPSEVFCYSNKKLMKDWPTADSGIIVGKFPNDVIGKVFVSVGVKRPYTMRTVVCGTKGTIICDNTSDHIHIYEDAFLKQTGSKFSRLPVNIANHNVAAEVREFIECLEKGEQSPTDVYEGSRTVAFGEAALESARKGLPVKVEKI